MCVCVCVVTKVSVYGFMTPDYMKYSDHYYDQNHHPVVFYVNHDFQMEKALWQRLHQAGLIQLYMRQWRQLTGNDIITVAGRRHWSRKWDRSGNSHPPLGELREADVDVMVQAGVDQTFIYANCSLADLVWLANHQKAP